MAGYILLAIGVLFGSVCTLLIFPRHDEPMGVLRIDNSDPEDGPYLFLELSSEAAPNVLKNKKYITLQVKAEDFISQE